MRPFTSGAERFHSAHARISKVIEVCALLVVADPVWAADVVTPRPDRSILWESEEAYGRADLGVNPFGAAGDSSDLDRNRRRGDEYGYDVTHVDLALVFDFSATSIAGTATLFVTITEAGLATLPVDLSNVLTVTGVRVDGAPRFSVHANDQISIPLPQPPPIGAELEIEVDYHGTPAPAGGAGSNRKGMRWGTHGAIPFVFTISTPFSTSGQTVIPVSHTWRPCKDVPDDKSTYSGHFTVRDDFRVASNGILTNETDHPDGTKTHTWEHDFPVAPYLITVAATNYVTVEYLYTGKGGSAAIEHFVWPEDLADASEDLDISVDAITALAARFGEYPFIGEKYGIFETNSGPAVEEQTMVAYPSSFINGAHTYDWIYVHELGHMWWGDAVTCASWAHVWLNEGFASYAEALWFESLGGSDALHDYMENMDTGPWAGTIVDPPYVWHSIVYGKGAWVLHMLRHIMGDAAFFEGLAGYRDAHEGGNATSEDFVTAMEAAHGSSLDEFFDSWLYFEGEPQYEYFWDEGDGDGASPTVELIVRQVQSDSYPTYQMPIDVTVTTVSGPEHFVISNSERVEHYSLPVSDAPLAVELDPDNWILGDIVRVPAGVGDPTHLSVGFFAPPSPNPVSTGTRIAFGLSREGRVALRMFDAGGRVIRTLVRGHREAGPHHVDWDGQDDEGRPVANGAYYLQLVSSDGVRQQNLIVLRRQ